VTRGIAVALVVLGCVASSRHAAANGRFPAATQLVMDQSDSLHLLVRTTYGLLESTDGGNTWMWICDQVVGFGPYDDPAIGIGARGALLAGLANADGVSMSRDHGCSWSRARPPLLGEIVVDLAVHPTDAARAVVITSTAGADDAGRPTYRTLLVETADNGQSWHLAGKPLPDDLFADTVDFAPSRPGRIYMSATRVATGKGVVARTDDDGQTWTLTDLLVDEPHSPWIGSVDPLDADKIYVRLSEDGGDRLLMSSDGATTFTQLYRFHGPMLGFALSPDGSRLAIGGPQDGILVGSAPSFDFQQTSGVLASCLTWRQSGLFACGSIADGFTVGLSHDEGKTFAALYALEQFCPRTCPADSTFSAVCPVRWQKTRDEVACRPPFACPNLPAAYGADPLNVVPSGAQCNAGVVDAGLEVGAPAIESGDANSTGPPTVPSSAKQGCCLAASGRSRDLPAFETVFGVLLVYGSRRSRRDRDVEAQVWP
jgi:photosystem II stability/assembly factor-like uncharacterized protein